ncbi:MAG: hypothetical protein OEM59_08755 [Rhodospirillales bacterium]|nr:hypothetical protein [Rhodospirillales bacterium]
MKEMLDIGEHLNAADQLVGKLDDVQELNNYKRAIGNLMGLIYTEVMVPIIKNYPDLDPDK